MALIAPELTVYIMTVEAMIMMIYIYDSVAKHQDPILSRYDFDSTVRWNWPIIEAKIGHVMMKLTNQESNSTPSIHKDKILTNIFGAT